MLNRKQMMSVVGAAILTVAMMAGCGKTNNQGTAASNADNQPVVDASAALSNAIGKSSELVGGILSKLNEQYEAVKRESNLDAQIKTIQSVIEEKKSQTGEAVEVYEKKIQEMTKFVLNRFNKDLKIASFKDEALKDLDLESFKAEAFSDLAGSELEQKIKEAAEAVNLKYKATLIKNQKNLESLKGKVGQATGQIIDQAKASQYMDEIKKQQSAIEQKLNEIKEKETAIESAIRDQIQK